MQLQLSETDLAFLAVSLTNPPAPSSTLIHYSATATLPEPDTRNTEFLTTPAATLAIIPAQTSHPQLLQQMLHCALDPQQPVAALLLSTPTAELRNAALALDWGWSPLPATTSYLCIAAETVRRVPRPSVIAQRRFQEHRDDLTTLDLANRFRYIFDRNLWGGDESRSGLGSSLQETRQLRQEIVLLLRELGATSLLDIPCGDFHWLSQVDLGVRYTGADIVPAIIERNIAQFSSPNHRFLTLDLTKDPLPTADVLLCRDCLVHLSFDNVDKALRNIVASKTRYLLTTHFPNLASNHDIADGDWRALNFELAPFHLPPPERLIIEHCEEGSGAYRDKSLALWPIESLAGSGSRT